jgi:hypothetical protein
VDLISGRYTTMLIGRDDLNKLSKQEPVDDCLSLQTKHPRPGKTSRPSSKPIVYGNEIAAEKGQAGSGLLLDRPE